ncbi:MAG TPA: GxxExxY protein [Acetobacteraceae bacterium]|nr:GxxExxY protein [Acetobacteraceae bacterium]
MLTHGALTERVIGLAIQVHRALGPGLLESAYEECLCFELGDAGIRYARQVPLPLIYRNIRLDCSYQMDAVVEQSLILGIKAIEQLRPLHDAQLLTYLRLSGCAIGLILNFHTVVLKDGIRRLIL